jgi:DNA transformation protein
VAVAPETRAFALELFENLGNVTARAMMGRLTFYAGGLIFAIVSADERIYIKAGGNLASDMAEAGAEKFTYERPGRKTGHMGYWTLPDSALDDPEEACAWARRSLAASHPGFS